MRIKTTRTLTANPTESTVTIERLDDYEHSHDLERRREIAPSGLAIQLARAEAEKGYSAAQILIALRGTGTTEGSKHLEEAGGAHLRRYFEYILLAILKIVIIFSNTNLNVKLGSILSMQHETYPNPTNVYHLKINLSAKMLNWQSVFLLKRDGSMLSTQLKVPK